jgi:catechol 2,3-dioxygenase-like lactoylglutathione lyase family enzyme
MAHLDLVALVVAEYDPAIDFFVNVLQFDLIEDVPWLTNDGRPKRWVVVRPKGGSTGILLARADGDRQTPAIGNQFAGRVGFFLRVDDFDAAHARMTAAGVTFVGAPRAEAYGKVAVFLDIAGNRWDLLGPRPTPTIHEAEAAIRAAQLAGDVDALERLIADDLVFTGPDGLIYGKQDDLDAHRNGLIRISELTPSEEHIRDLGSTVVVSVRMQMRGSFQGAEFAGPFRYTRIWRASERGWQIVAGHVSAVQAS